MCEGGVTVVNMCGICISVCGTVAVVCVYNGGNSYDVIWWHRVSNVLRLFV